VSVTIPPLGAARLIVWDRQARRNAWDLATMTEIADAIEAAGDDPGVRCVVLRGAGDHWSAGDDLHAALESTRDDWAATIAGFQRLTRVVLASPLPVICAIDGWCVGGALEFAASCDVRLCTQRVRLLTPEVNIGFVFSNGGSFFLPHVIGVTGGRALLLGGVPCDFADAPGFATELVADLDEAVERWAGAFDARSRPAVAATKRILNERWGDLIERALEREEHWCVELFDTAEAQAALQSFRDR
jgi:enoyl-CoA hydratase/carnithine racemase